MLRVHSFIISLILLITLSSAHATDFVVTEFEDGYFNDDTVCTLREAIAAANENVPVDGCPAGQPDDVAVDTITLGAGTYTLSLICDEVTCLSGDYGIECGDLNITEDLIINGAGTESTIVEVAIDALPSGDSEDYHFRAFDIRAFDEETISTDDITCDEGCTPGLEVTFSNFTIQGGQDYYGGAVHFDDGTYGSCEYTSLTLTNMNAVNNRAHYGGGAVAGYGQLTVNNSTFNNNQVGDDYFSFGDGDGGAIYLAGPESGCYDKFASSITDSSITENTATQGSGGGIYNAYQSNLTITDTAIDNNRAYDLGGGIFNRRSDLTINGGTISNNRGVEDFFCDGDGCANNDDEEYGTYEGGGIYNEFRFRPNDPTFQGLDETRTNAVSITGTTISGNIARYLGGGIANSTDRRRSTVTGEMTESEDTFTITESTISNNMLQENLFFDRLDGESRGEGVYSGAGIFNGAIYSGKFYIIDSTISGNEGGFSGAGVSNFWSMDITGSTISNNKTSLTEPRLQIGSLGGDENFITTSGGGGGIVSFGSTLIQNSTISGNETIGAGAGVISVVSGPYYYTCLGPINPINGAVDLTECQDPNLRLPGTQLQNTTITENIIRVPVEDDNSSDVGPFGGQNVYFVNNGAGIAVLSGNISVRNSIIAKNIDESENFAFEDLNFDDPADIPNFAPDCWAHPAIEDFCGSGPGGCEVPQSSIISEGYNLIGDNTGCQGDESRRSDFGEAENDNFDKIGTGDAPIDPLLGPLADNGGPTESHLPLLGSPAIDMGNPNPEISDDASQAGLGGEALADPAAVACRSNDQRGLSRSVAGLFGGPDLCDIGSVEVRTDCNSDPQGSAEVDACGVCGGDGTSCITPDPTPDVGVECTELDISSTQFEMDGTTIAQADLAERVAGRLRKRTGKKKAGEKIVANAVNNADAAWAQTWGISSTIQTECVGATDTCVTVSNVSNLNEYIFIVSDNHTRIKKLIRRLKNTGIARKKVRNYRKQNNQLKDTGVGLASTVPEEDTQCGGDLL